MRETDDLPGPVCIQIGTPPRAERHVERAQADVNEWVETCLKPIACLFIFAFLAKTRLIRMTEGKGGMETRKTGLEVEEPRRTRGVENERISESSSFHDVRAPLREHDTVVS